MSCIDNVRNKHNDQSAAYYVVLTDIFRDLEAQALLTPMLFLLLPMHTLEELSTLVSEATSLRVPYLLSVTLRLYRCLHLPMLFLWQWCLTGNVCYLNKLWNSTKYLDSKNA